MADFENLPSTNTPLNATNLNKLLGYKGILENNTNLNNLTNNGIYYTSNRTLINAGNDYQYCYLWVIGYEGAKHQYLIKPISLGIMMREYSGSPSQWTEWRQMEDKSTTVGTGTFNGEYISSAERNQYSRAGQVVSYGFTLTVTGTWNNTTEFISNLPRARSEVRFMGINSTTYTPMRFNLTTSGEIQNAYSDNPPSNGNIIEGQITYITTD